MFTLLISVSLVMTIMFLSYMTFILVPYLRYKPVEPGNADDFEWHIFVPCRDEAAVIASTIRRQRERFPQAHLWVIDDDSDDETSAIIQDHAATDPHVHLVQRRRPEARTGKGDALNAAYHAMNLWLPDGTDRTKVIVTVVDADGEMAENALSAVAAEPYFGNPAVGAAQITVWMKNRDDTLPFPDKGKLSNAFGRLLVRMQDIEFRVVVLAMQSLRTETGTVGLGGNGQFTRLSVLDVIAEGYDAPWHGSLLEDYELGLHVILSGYENRHVHETYVAQEALPSFRRLFTQRSRWSQGNIHCLKYVKEITKSRHFDSAGLLESLYYLVLPLIQLVGLLAMGGMLAWVVSVILTEPLLAATFVEHLWAYVLLIVVFGYGPFIIWGIVYKLRCEPQATWAQAVGWGFCLCIYGQHVNLTAPNAMFRIITRRTGWSKTRRNAEALTAGPIALDK